MILSVKIQILTDFRVFIKVERRLWQSESIGDRRRRKQKENERKRMIAEAAAIEMRKNTPFHVYDPTAYERKEYVIPDRIKTGRPEDDRQYDLYF